MSPVSDNEILNAFEIVLPYLADLFDNEASISLMDTEKCLINQSCPALAIRAVPGDRMPEGGAARQAIDTGTTVIKDIPKKSNDSVPFKSYSVPIKDDDGNVIGAISMGKSLAKREEVTSFSQILSSNLSQITVAVNDLSTTIQDVVKTNSENIVFVNDTNEKAGETNEILSVVRRVARQTHLLGINASIEAARAGQNGKSFEVVANEIRSLSDSVSNSMNKMEDVLSGINEAIAGIKIRIEKTNETFQNQAASLEEVAASIDSLNHTAYKLNELSEML